MPNLLAEEVWVAQIINHLPLQVRVMLLPAAGNLESVLSFLRKIETEGLYKYDYVQGANTARVNNERQNNNTPPRAQYNDRNNSWRQKN